MIHLIGAIACCVISVHCIRKSYSIYIEERGVVTTVLAFFFAVVGILSGLYAGAAMAKFTEIMGWAL